MLDMHVTIVMKCGDTGKMTVYSSGKQHDDCFNIQKAAKEIEAWEAKNRTVKYYIDSDYDKLKMSKNEQDDEEHEHEMEDEVQVSHLTKRAAKQLESSANSFKKMSDMISNAQKYAIKLNQNEIRGCSLALMQEEILPIKESLPILEQGQFRSICIPDKIKNQTAHDNHYVSSARRFSILDFLNSPIEPDYIPDSNHQLSSHNHLDYGDIFSAKSS